MPTYMIFIERSWRAIASSCEGLTMKVVVLIPGIMGSELKLNGIKVWPPTLREIASGYRRVDDLASSSVQVGDIIRALYCYGVYQSLIDQLASWGFVESA